MIMKTSKLYKDMEKGLLDGNRVLVKTRLCRLLKVHARDWKD